MTMHRHIRGHYPLEYYLTPHKYAKRLKADLHAMHELNEKTTAELEAARKELAEAKAKQLAAEYQQRVLNELNSLLSKPHA